MTGMHLLREWLRDLVLPPGGPLLLMLAGACCVRRWRSLAAVLLGAGMGSLWLLSTPIVADGLVRAVERYPALDLSIPTQAQAVVILAAGSRRAAPEYGSDAPDADTLVRLVYGAYVARRTGLPVLVSGGVVDTRQSLATIMRTFLERDLATSVRWIEERSHDTHENAMYSAPILRAAGVHRIILVSSAAHLCRAVAEFQMTGLAVVPAPVGLLTPMETGIRRWIVTSTALNRSKWALYEMLGEMVRRVRATFT
jgi:uncharacterized SAM-binding protein YcdF (DUF218 family)